MPTPNTEQRKLAAIMFTDMVGYSALAQRNEAMALELLEEHRALLRPLFPRFNGTEIKTIGDAFLVEFHSALEAAQCAIEMQRALAKRNHDVPTDRRVEIKIGIHIGDVVHRDGDVYGDGVNIASRIEPLAGPSGICISTDVERQIRNALETRFVKLGPRELKNISVPMELFRIVLPWEEHKATSRPLVAGDQSAKKLHSRVLLGVAVLVLLNLGLALWFLGNAPKSRLSQQRVSEDREKAATTQGAIRSLAVKPLDNFSGDTNSAYLSDGMTEALCSALGNISALRVPGRSSLMRYKGAQTSIRDMGKELDVDAVLEGSIQRAGNRMLITVQLVEASNDRHLWSTNYERDLSDFFQVQNEVAEAVAREVNIKLKPQEARRLASASKIDPAANEAYLRGRYYFWQFSPEASSKALAMFIQATNLAPDFAPPYAGLADYYVFQGGSATAKAPREVMPQAKAAVLKALELDPDLPDAHATLAWILFSFDHDWAGAGKAFDHALAMNPNCWKAHFWRGFYFAGLTRLNDSVAEFKYADHLEPFSPMHDFFTPLPYLWSAQYDRAFQEADRIFQSNPTNATAAFQLAMVELQEGKFEQAIPRFEESIKGAVGTRNWMRAVLGNAYATAGKRPEAEVILKELLDRSKREYVSASDIALIYAGLNQRDQSFEWLDKALEERSVDYALAVEPRWKNLREDPRFQVLLRKMHYPR